ncbi:TIR domain-containing protein [Actinoplanes sp. URMC 104]|uniref:TIR domain-containing protein n=1 Tax=Actinoplanes sp. URMC 104 TaxID=3423409 RepID=UPI003F1C507C
MEVLQVHLRGHKRCALSSGSAAIIDMTARVQTSFISYSRPDVPWARWIGWQLEAAGYRVILQDWDFSGGDVFLAKMNDALRDADRTIVLLSRSYAASHYCRQEWTAAVRTEEDGKAPLLPFRVEDCPVQDPLLASRVYLDLFGLSRQDARDLVLAQVRGAGRPRAEPPFPGAEPPYPATAAEEPAPVAVGHVPADFPIFGRSEEVQRLVRHLLAKTKRPVPVIGGPGIGKTAICVKALRNPRVVKHFGSRRYWVRCNGALSAEAVLAMLATSLNVRTGPADPLPQICALLERAPSVVVLDNADTPWEADPDGTEALLQRLAAVSGLALVASIRGRQRPDYVPWQKPIEVRPLSPRDGRRLFLDKAGHGFADDPHLDEIIAAQDGLPLTISLLAWQAQGGVQPR